MISAVLVALMVWCVVPMTARPRLRRLFGAAPSRLIPRPGLVAAALTPLAGIVLLGVPWGVMVGLAVAPLVQRAFGRLESSAARRRLARMTASLPAALDLMVAALEVGRPPVVAFALAAEATADPLGQELGLIAGRLEVAADSDSVWIGVVGDQALAPVGRAFRRAEASGMPVAHVVSGVADELRREHHARRRQRSLKVAVRTAAPLGVCFLPAFFLIGIVPTIVATFQSFTW